MDERPARMATIISAHELMNMVDKGILSIPEARRLILGPEVSDYPAGRRQADDFTVGTRPDDGINELEGMGRMEDRKRKA